MTLAEPPNTESDNYHFLKKILKPSLTQMTKTFPHVFTLVGVTISVNLSLLMRTIGYSRSFPVILD